MWTLRIIIAAAAVLVATEAGTQSRLDDLAARIEFGFFTHDPAIVAAAREQVRGKEDARSLYMQGFAAFRLAQLGAAAEAGVCVDQADRAVDENEEDAEAWLLLAACAREGARNEPVKGVLLRRRMQQAIERAHALEPSNPRLALLRAQIAYGEADSASLLESAVEAYRNWPAPFDWPNWGEAEALTELGELYLERHDFRDARDALEEALQIAPDFVRARAAYDLLVAN